MHSVKNLLSHEKLRFSKSGEVHQLTTCKNIITNIINFEKLSDFTVCIPHISFSNRGWFINFAAVRVPAQYLAEGI